MARRRSAAPMQQRRSASTMAAPTRAAPAPPPPAPAKPAAAVAPPAPTPTAPTATAAPSQGPGLFAQVCSSLDNLLFIVRV
jgi:hypothetical protein